MNASYSWLRAFVPFDLSPARLRDLLTARVATVDELVPLRADLSGIVVGRVVEARRHPNADKLWATRVDAGTGELLEVVCGAPNVVEGKLYPFAPAGTTIPGGLKIERRKIRGEVSNGMLCSARELGLGEEGGGILELDVSAAPGTPLLDAMPLGDTRIVIDVLPNRPDLLSHLGLAREIAAVTALPLSMPEIPGAPESTPVSAELSAVDRQLREMASQLASLARSAETLLGRAIPHTAALARLQQGAGAVAVAIESPQDASRYAGLVVRGVKVGPSPEWLVRRVEAVGSRSINNVVDATNYVLHELGQPLHAFDLYKIAGGRISVRRARAGESLVTLDGVERTLDPEMSVIADAERAIAVAGVMGGRDTEVTESTTDLFIESATFDQRRTRITRRRLGLSTDASYRFERGVDPELPVVALERVAKVILATAGGSVDGAPIEADATLPEQRLVSVRPDRVARLLGERVDDQEIMSLLASVGFLVTDGEDGALLADVPSWRRDVHREVDLIEEVARLRGYDSFPDELRPFRPGNVPDDPLYVTSGRVRAALVAAGLLETRAMPFVAGAGTGHVRVTNPLAENEAHLRTSVLESLAKRAEYNLAHMQGNVRLFEIGAVFAPGGTLPREEMRVALLVMGDRRPPHFTEPRPPRFDEWDAKALAELLARAALPTREARLEPGDGTDVLWNIVADRETIGAVRHVPLDAPDWAAPAFGVELRLGVVSSDAPAREAPGAVYRAAAGAAAVRSYRALPTTPSAWRDVSLLVPDSTPAAELERVMRTTGGELLESATLVDSFSGGGVPAGHRSLTWRLTFRHPERTLRDKEVEGRSDRILRALEDELGVRQRT
ncbi:MAG TPA: phenylalanine--tRNA ligase subunit beta [Gemmatimonadaceae bacterium]|nr:phenylalanine--tRNA ligase subunit beta [Gemmatimonadaceae bacterium]